ncbi:MAG: hypothetical protein MR890_06520 [Akkermansia muciniphila]|nr:hypothetical protein [Akkermansia muciniphila]
MHRWASFCLPLCRHAITITTPARRRGMLQARRTSPRARTPFARPAMRRGALCRRRDTAADP